MGCRLWGEWTGGGDGSSESEDSDMDTKKHKSKRRAKGRRARGRSREKEVGLLAVVLRTQVTLLHIACKASNVSGRPLWLYIVTQIHMDLV